jgi:hypothetical protein
MLRQVYAVCAATARQQPAPSVSPALPEALLAQARRLDAEHRAATGKPVSRDSLRASMRIGRDLASALVAVVRTETAACGAA